MLSKVFIRKNRVNVSILLFLVIFSIVHYVKPSFLYTKEGGFREFGVGYSHKTVIPIWIVAIVVGIVSYLAVNYYERV